MKNSEREELLEDLLEPRGGGLSVEQMLGAIRRERAARRSRLGFAAGAAILAAWWFFGGESGNSSQGPRKQGEVAAVSVPPPLEIRRMTDEELLESIDAPAALVTLPDGRKTLLVLQPN